MGRSPGLRAADMTICESRTPQKTRSIRFEHAHPPPSFHSFDTPSRDPFTILIYRTSHRWIRTYYCIPDSYFIRSLFTSDALLIAVFQIRPANDGGDS